MSPNSFTIILWELIVDLKLYWLKSKYTKIAKKSPKSLTIHTMHCWFETLLAISSSNIFIALSQALCCCHQL